MTAAIAEREAQLSPRHPRDALYPLKCCPTVLRITQTDRVSARGALSATVTLYSSTCIAYSFDRHGCNRLNYRTASMQCCACHQQTSVQPILLMSTVQLDHNCEQPMSKTTNVVEDTAYYSANAPSWTRTSVADGHKFPEVRRMSRRLLDRSIDAMFTHPTCIWRPCWGWRRWNFVEIFYVRKLVHWLLYSVVCVILQCRLVTDRRTDGHTMTANTALV